MSGTSPTDHPVTTAALRAVGAVVLVASQACYIPIGHGAKPEVRLIPLRGEGSQKAERATSLFGPKSVLGKENPTRLIARDGTSCIVSQKKFDSAEIGESVWCTWIG